MANSGFAFWNILEFPISCLTLIPQYFWFEVGWICSYGTCWWIHRTDWMYRRSLCHRWHYWEKGISLSLFGFFFSRPGIEPALQLQPAPRLWQRSILNLLPHKGTLLSQSLSPSFLACGSSCGMWKFLGKELNPCHSCSLYHSFGNAGSFITCCAIGKFFSLFFCFVPSFLPPFPLLLFFSFLSLVLLSFLLLPSFPFLLKNFYGHMEVLSQEWNLSCSCNLCRAGYFNL